MNKSNLQSSSSKNITFSNYKLYKIYQACELLNLEFTDFVQDVAVAEAKKILDTHRKDKIKAMFVK